MSARRARSARGAPPGLVTNRLGYTTLLLALWGMTAGIPGAVADDAPLGEIVVRGARPTPTAPVEDETAFATVIDTTDKTAEADTVADVLAETVGVHVRSFGGLGAFSTVSVRGSAPGQVQVYLDGVPLSRARSEVLDVSTLPLDAVERIEVYRGFVPIAFTRAGPGGVVNLITRRPADEPRTNVSASYGSFDSRKVSVERSQRLGAWEYLGFATYTGSEGDFSFRDDNGTPGFTLDDTTATRVNNDFNAVDVLAKAGYRFAERTTVGVTNQLFYKDQGVPGISSNQARDTRLRELRNLMHVRAELAGVGIPALDLRATGHILYDRARFSDRSGEIGVGNQDSDDDTVATGIDGLFTYYWGRHLVPSLLLAAGYETFLPGDRLDPANAGPDQSRVQVGVGAQNEIYLFTDRFLVVPSVRWDYLDDDFSGSLPAAVAGAPEPRQRTDSFTSPRLGVRLAPVPFLAVRGNIARLYRPPNFTELFGDRGVVSGSGGLDPEKAFNRDIGLQLTPRDLRVVDDVLVEYAYFDNEIDDLIVFVPTSQNVLTPQNVSRATVSGHEVNVSLRAWGHVRLSANYTHQDAVDESPEPSRKGKRLPGRPADEGYVRHELFGRLGRLYYEATIIGDNFRAPGERDRVGSRAIHNVGVSVTPPGTGLTATFEARNITDDQVADFEGFPLPGLSFVGTVRYVF
jgi:iron complex outermembrane receptor protein